MKKYLYLWLIPLLWSASSLFSFNFPGDEYAIYSISSIAGSWFVMIFPIGGDIHDFVFRGTITAIGAIVMLIIGLLMSKLKVNFKLWLLFYLIASIAIFLLSINSYPSIERALSKNGSYWAYIFGSLNLGLYISIIFSLITAFAKKIKTNKPLKSFDI